MTSKIVPLEALAKKSDELRRKGRRVVLSHGVFDLIHTGHIRHLQRAREEGDALFVTVTADAHVNKGPGRPVFTDDLRAEALAALSCVDFVAVNHASTAINVIEAIRPHVYAKGADYRSAADDVTGNITHERSAVESHGGRIVFTDEITFSSSSLLNEHFGVFTPETKAYLQEFRGRFSADAVIRDVQSLAGLKVLVVGDAIIDEYHYTSPLGQSGKGNILAVRYESEEKFAGGAIAAANHLAGFAGRVTLATALGAQESHEAFIRSKLARRIEPVFFYRPDAPTVVKRRFVDPDMAKLFEVYLFKNEALAPETDREVCAWLRDRAAEYDLVVVPDFGNGLVSSAMIDTLCGRAKFLAVNTQVNSGNRGYHVINRYPRADFVSLNEPELRLASHNRHDPVEAVAASVGRSLGARFIAVTLGTKGAMMTDLKSGTVHHVPALSTKVVDRIGAGDCFLSLAGLTAGAGIDPAVSVFVGSAAAALAVQIVGNRAPVDPVSLFKYITTLLK